jgi:hypothetical protein
MLDHGQFAVPPIATGDIATFAPMGNAPALLTVIFDMRLDQTIALLMTRSGTAAVSTFFHRRQFARMRQYQRPHDGLSF